MAELLLSNGGVAIVDPWDYEWAQWIRWHHDVNGYAKAHPNLYLHRAIVNAPAGTQVDHANRNRLDDRRDNLRFCSRGENMYNAGSRGGSSRYKGVYLKSKRNWVRWAIKMRINGKDIHLGCFKDELSAAKAYDEAALVYHGAFAKLNCPIEEKKDG